jgi:hypothetical protein
MCAAGFKPPGWLSEPLCKPLYFGNLTLGDEVCRHAKVRAIVSGHTHIGREGQRVRPGLPPLAYRVVPSEYGDPRHVLLEL